MCSIIFCQVRKSWGFLFLSPFLSLALSRLLSRFRSLTASFQGCFARSLLWPSVFCSLALCHLVSRSRARALSLSLSLSLLLSLCLSLHAPLNTSHHSIRKIHSLHSSLLISQTTIAVFKINSTYNFFSNYYLTILKLL